MSAPQPISSTMANEERSSFTAALVYPIIILIGGVIGFLIPAPFTASAPAIVPLLGVIMFSMGLTLVPKDFALVAKRPFPVLVGVAAQFVVMPLLAVGIAWAMNLPAAIAAGVILVGCAPGGTASNVVTYLARGDVALSVTMTSISTLLAPILTPILTLWLAGQYVPVPAGLMALTIVKMVLVPIVLGISLRLVFPKIVDKVLAFLPWLAVFATTYIVAIVVAGSADKIFQAGVLVFVAVVLHNGFGLTLGYLIGRVAGVPVKSQRTIGIEVGMQNSGLASTLATQYMNPIAALPAAMFSVWHSISGALFAVVFRLRDKRAGESVTGQSSGRDLQ